MSPVRSGSSLLRKMCHEPPYSHFLFQPFNLNQLRKLGINKSLKVVQNRMDNPSRFLNFLFSKYHNESVGAKVIITSKANHTLENICRNKNFKIILLYRKNLSESFVSRELARTTGRWGLQSGDPLPKIKNTLHFNYQGIEKFSNKVFRKLSACKRILDDRFTDDYLVLSYEDLVDKNLKIDMKNINIVREFVGISKLRQYNPTSQKQNDEKTYSMIENRQELDEKCGKMYGYLGQRSEPLIWKDF